MMKGLCGQGERLGNGIDKHYEVRRVKGEREFFCRIKARSA